MKQIDMYEWLEMQSQNTESKRLVMNKMNNLEHNILLYMKDNCIGFENAISGVELSEIFGITPEQLRYRIKKIRISQNVIIGSDNKNGYYIPLQVEKKTALSYAENKVLSELETRVRQSPDFLLKAYKKLNELSNNIDIVLQDQIQLQFNGWEKDFNMFGDKYLNNKNKEEEK